LASEISLSITGIVPEIGGNLVVFLFRESNWMKLKTPSKVISLRSDMKSITVVMENITDGEYAIQVVHDRDKNGKLTMKWTPPGPIEGYGFSAGYKPTGIPKYSPAKIVLKEGMTVPVVMGYPQK